MCTYTIYGCTVAGADNYAPYVTNIAGMCQYGGCNDTEANNYNPTATYNDGSCTYPLIGCTVRAERSKHRRTHASAGSIATEVGTGGKGEGGVRLRWTPPLSVGWQALGTGLRREAGRGGLCLHARR